MTRRTISPFNIVTRVDRVPRPAPDTTRLNAEKPAIRTLGTRYDAENDYVSVTYTVRV